MKAIAVAETEPTYTIMIIPERKGEKAYSICFQEQY